MIRCLLLSIYVLIASCGSGQQSDPVGYVNDFEGILTEQEEAKLIHVIEAHEKATTNQISIVTIDSIDPYTDIFEYGLDLANEWGVGQEDKDNGVLIVVSKNLRKISIQIGYGLEEKFTDTEAQYIIDSIMAPAFRKEDYFTGFSGGVATVIKEIK